jgi:hypothetical protein
LFFCEEESEGDDEDDEAEEEVEEEVAELEAEEEEEEVDMFCTINVLDCVNICCWIICSGLRGSNPRGISGLPKWRLKGQTAVIKPLTPPRPFMFKTPPFEGVAAASAAATWGSSWSIFGGVVVAVVEEERIMVGVEDAGVAAAVGRLLLALLNIVWLRLLLGKKEVEFRVLLLLPGLLLYRLIRGELWFEERVIHCCGQDKGERQWNACQSQGDLGCG